MYKLNINDRVDQYFPNKSQFAKAVGISREAAVKLCNGETTRISFDTLTSICKALHCTPNDVFINDEENTPAESHDKIKNPKLAFNKSVLINLSKKDIDKSQDIIKEHLKKYLEDYVDSLVDDISEQVIITKLDDTESDGAK